MRYSIIRINSCSCREFSGTGSNATRRHEHIGIIKMNLLRKCMPLSLHSPGVVAREHREHSCVPAVFRFFCCVFSRTSRPRTVGAMAQVSCLSGVERSGVCCTKPATETVTLYIHRVQLRVLCSYIGGGFDFVRIGCRRRSRRCLGGRSSPERECGWSLYSAYSCRCWPSIIRGKQSSERTAAERGSDTFNSEGGTRKHDCVPCRL